MATKTSTKSTKRILPDLAAQKRIAELEAQVAALNAAKEANLKLKVSDKGAVSVYGIRRFPITFYKGEWEKIFNLVPQLQEFIAKNEDDLAVK